MRSLFHNPHKLSFIVQIRRISVIEPDITLGHAIKKTRPELEMELFLR